MCSFENGSAIIAESLFRFLFLHYQLLRTEYRSKHRSRIVNRERRQQRYAST